MDTFDYQAIIIIVTFASSSVTILFDSFFIILYYYHVIKLKVVTNFLLKSVVNLIWANLLRVIFLSTVFVFGPIADYTDLFCNFATFPLELFKIAQYFWTFNLAYTLLYKVVAPQINSTHVPGEKFLFLFAWGSSFIIAVLVIIFDTSDYGAFGCPSKTENLSADIVVGIALFFNTIILILLIFYIKCYRKQDSSLSKSFYLVVVITFDYLKIPIFVITVYSGYDNISVDSRNIFIAYIISLFIDTISGTFISCLFSYNLNYFHYFKNNINCYCNINQNQNDITLN